MKREFQRDVFLCHASQDKERIVRPFTEELKTRGVSFWYDEAEIRVGDSITKKIDEGLQESRYVVAFISESFLERKWPDRELRSALSSSIGEGSNKVLPVLVGLKSEQFFERYHLLRDIRFATLTDNLAQLADEIKDIVRVSSAGQNFNKPDPTEVTFDRCLSSIRQLALRPDRWFRITTDANDEPHLTSKGGTEALTARLQKRDIPVRINWDKVATPRKRLVANTLLALVEAFNTKDVKGFDEHLLLKPGVFIHSFDRPKYSRKYSKELSVKAASGCIVDSNWLILLNVPAFFDVGWRDKLSMAPLSVARLRFGSVTTDVLQQGKFNPWIPYDLRPAVVLCPTIALAKPRRAELQRFKYAPNYSRVALSPARFTRSDGQLLHNNGFLVIDGLSNIDSTVVLARTILESSEVI